MRKTIVTCDQCRGEVKGWQVVYGVQPMPGTSYASWEGQRFVHEFCSTGCMFTWIMARFKELRRF